MFVIRLPSLLPNSPCNVPKLELGLRANAVRLFSKVWKIPCNRESYVVGNELTCRNQ